MIPETVPYTAAFIERSPPRPNTNSTAETTPRTAEGDQPTALFERILVAAGRIAEVDEQREPDDDHDRADHLAPPDVLLRQEVAERQGEDDRRDEQRLDHDEPAAVERAGLEQVARDEHEGADEPGHVAGEPDERLRVGERDRRKVQRAALLQRRRQREAECRDQCEGCSHARSLERVSVDWQRSRSSVRGAEARRCPAGRRSTASCGVRVSRERGRGGEVESFELGRDSGGVLGQHGRLELEERDARSRRTTWIEVPP